MSSPRAAQLATPTPTPAPSWRGNTPFWNKGFLPYTPNVQDAAHKHLPVLTVGPQSEYYPSGAAVPTIPIHLSGSDLYIQPGPSEDVYVYLSPNLQSQITAAIDQNCDTPGSAVCQASVANTVRNSTLDLQSRSLQIGALVLSALSTFLIYFIANEDYSVPSVVHFDHSDLAQVSSIAAASASVIYVENSKTGQYITFPSRPTAVTGALPSVSQLTSPMNGHAAGDVLLIMSETLAKSTQEVILRQNICHDELKRAVGFDCIGSAAQGIIEQAVPGGLLHDLVMTQGRFPQFAAVGTEAVRALTTAMNFARDFAPQLGISELLAEPFGTLAFALAYDVLVNHATLAATYYFPASELVHATITAPPTSTKTGCAATASVLCNKPGCAVGARVSVCDMGYFAGCRCANQATPKPPTPYNASQEMFMASVMEQLLVGLDVSPMSPDCWINSTEPLFNGNPAAYPATYCECLQTDQSGAKVTGTGTYNTITSRLVPSDQCAYTSLPSTTIDVSTVSVQKNAPIHTCRTVTYTLPFTVATMKNQRLCTCDDNSVWPLTVTSSGSSTISHCPDTTPTFSAAPSLPPLLYNATAYLRRITYSYPPGQPMWLPSGGISWGFTFYGPGQVPNVCQPNSPWRYFTSNNNNELPSITDISLGALGTCTYTSNSEGGGGLLYCPSALPSSFTCQHKSPTPAGTNCATAPGGPDGNYLYQLWAVCDLVLLNALPM